MRAPFAAIGLVLALGLACAAPSPSSTTTSQLRPSSELKANCFGFPDRRFSRRNFAEVEALLETGDAALDFTLDDPQGKQVRLKDLLDDKPVLLLQGNLTCPRFQENRRALEATTRKYGDDVHVLLVYNIEAHPRRDPSPYRGNPWELKHTDRRQASTWSDRARSAREVARTSQMQIVVDALDARNANPVWCTYGTCPSCSWLIRRDGTIAAHHDWHDPPTMDRSIESLLAEGG